jgi:hypothetical protein
MTVQLVTKILSALLVEELNASRWLKNQMAVKVALVYPYFHPTKDNQSSVFRL